MFAAILIPAAQVAFLDQPDSLTCPQESAQYGRNKAEIADPTKTWMSSGRNWLGGRDSNPDTQIQSLQSYR